MAKIICYDESIMSLPILFGIITLHAYARGKVIGSVVIITVIHIKIARSGDLGVIVSYKLQKCHNSI